MQIDHKNMKVPFPICETIAISPCFSPLSIPINYVPPQDNDNALGVHFPYLHEQAQGTTKLNLTSPHDLLHQCQQMIFPNATLEKK